MGGSRSKQKTRSGAGALFFHPFLPAGRLGLWSLAALEFLILLPQLPECQAYGTMAGFYFI